MPKLLAYRPFARWGMAALVTTTFSLRTPAQTSPIGLGPVSLPSLGEVSDVDIAGPSVPPLQLGGFQINIVPGSGLSGNSAALLAFQRAASQWKAFIADPITVTVDADLVNLGNPGIIGSAGSFLLTSAYNTMRGQMVSDAANEPGDEIVNALPTAAQFTAFAPVGATISSSMLGTKANLKALGYSRLDATFGASDGTIQFNSVFSFDYDNSDGVSPGSVDFETVAAHEIGHVLGFISAVDTADTGGTTLRLTPWDLFRFRDGNASSDPDDLAEFTALARNLVPNSPDIFDDLTTEALLSTGDNLGDGRQASHWKDDGLTGLYLGMMDPTLANGVIQTITALDLRVLDLIGYEIGGTVPEASTTLSVLTAGALAGGWLRRRPSRLV